jgi:hypothetical protein
MQGYLTTPGQRRDEALAMIVAHGFEVEAGSERMDSAEQM